MCLSAVASTAKPTCCVRAAYKKTSTDGSGMPHAAGSCQAVNSSSCSNWLVVRLAGPVHAGAGAAKQWISMLSSGAVS